MGLCAIESWHALKMFGVLWLQSTLKSCWAAEILQQLISSIPKRCVVKQRGDECPKLIQISYWHQVVNEDIISETITFLTFGIVFVQCESSHVTHLFTFYTVSQLFWKWGCKQISHVVFPFRNIMSITDAWTSGIFITAGCPFLFKNCTCTWDCTALFEMFPFRRLNKIKYVHPLPRSPVFSSNEDFCCTNGSSRFRRVETSFPYFENQGTQPPHN